MKKSKTIFTVLILGIITFLIIFLIPYWGFLVYRIYFPTRDIMSEIDYGDMLAYFSAALAFVASTFLGLIALIQNRHANETNDKLMHLEKSSRQAHIMLDEATSSVDEHRGSLALFLSFKKIEKDILISDFCIYPRKKNDPINNDFLLDTNMKPNDDTKDNILYITKFDELPSKVVLLDDNHYDATLIYYPYKSSNYTIGFRTMVTSIYGYQTVQLFDVSISNNKISYSTTIQINE